MISEHHGTEDGDLIITVKNDANKLELICEKGNFTIHIEITRYDFTWKVIHGNQIDTLKGQLSIIILR